MKNVKLFLEWFSDRHASNIIAFVITYSILVGGGLLVIDNDARLEGFRFGWLYSLIRIPTYIGILISAVFCVWLVGYIAIILIREQVEDYRRFKRDKES